jgi:DNA repair exonuclease SbcCD ATPase subunit
MAESLSYEALKEMNFADYKKAFKEKSQWKKAKALVVLMDYKLGSRKMPIVLPLRRANQLKPLLKQIKKDKHPNPKLAGGLLQMDKGETGLELTFKMTQGGYPLEILESKVAPIIKQLLKCSFVAERSNEPIAETEEETTTQEQAPSDKTPPTQEKKAPELRETLQTIKRLSLQVRKEVVAHVQQKTVGEAQAAVVAELEAAIANFQAQYQTAEGKQQQQLAKHQQHIEQKIRPMLDKLQQAVEQLESEEQGQETNGEQPNDQAALKEQQGALVALFKEARQAVAKEGKAIVTRFKKKNNVFADGNVLQSISDKVDAFLSKYDAAAAPLQKKLAGAREKLEKQQATLKQVEQQLDEVELEPQSPQEVDEALTNIEKRIQVLKEKIAQQQQ